MKQFKFRFDPFVFWGVLLFLANLGFSVGGKAAWVLEEGVRYQNECFDNVALQVKYCVWTSAGNENKDVIYYMHGLGGSEQSWERDGILIRAAWARTGKTPPRVITLSFGQTWLLAEKNTSEKSGLLSKLFGEVLPEIEKKLEVQPDTNRQLFGISMGGFNAIQMIHHSPQMFSKVAVACPAITTVSPFAPDQDIVEYIRRTKAQENAVRRAINIARTYFPDETSWGRAWPLVLADQMSSLFPPMYVSGASFDNFGFQEGDMIFADRAKGHGVTMVSEMVWGPHCLYNGEAISKFFESSSNM